MTILTKSFEEKKSNVVLICPSPPPTAPADNGADGRNDVEQGGEILLPNGGPRRLTPLSNFAVFLSALAITCIGILSGVTIYRAFDHAHRHNLRFRGYCGVPYDSNVIDNDAMIYINSKLRDDSLELNNDLAMFQNSFNNDFQKLYNETFNSAFFKEEIELDMNDINNDNDGYAKITVPDFRDGRSGRFMHDFNGNQSGIIDNEARRCFVMPLDRETVLPPSSMYDLLQKMWSGFYNIDTNVVRNHMRVIMPAITDLSTVAPRIAAECENMKIYKLEKIDNKKYKRSAEPLDSSGLFAAFGGRKIATYDLDNIAELQKHENELNQNK